MGWRILSVQELGVKRKASFGRVWRPENCLGGNRAKNDRIRPLRFDRIWNPALRQRYRLMEERQCDRGARAASVLRYQRHESVPDKMHHSSHFDRYGRGAWRADGTRYERPSPE